MLRLLILGVLGLVTLLSFVQLLIAGSESSLDPAAAQPPRPARDYVVAFVTHKRTDLLEVGMRSFLGQPDAKKFDVLISLDHPDSEPRVRTLMSSLETDFPFITGHVNLIIKPDEPARFFAAMPALDQRIDQHIFFALRQAFTPEYRYGILLEEDLELSPDFVELMVLAAPLLDSDNTLFCVSGWNDNGRSQVEANPSRLMRTDVFNNLSFLFRREEALKILARWPGYDFWGWDQWMRTELATKQRECIVPELSRLRHIGSNGRHVKDNSGFMALPFAHLESGLGTFTDSLKRMSLEVYDADLRRKLANAKMIDIETALKPDFVFAPGSDYLVPIQFEDCLNYELMWKALITRREVCRMTHRGLFEGHPSDDTTVYFVDRRSGAEWLPKELWVAHEGLRAVPSSPGKTCDDRCREIGLVCSSHDAAHINTCEAIGSVLDCERCTQSEEHRGPAAKPPVEYGMWSRFFRPAAQECLVSKLGGFFCDEPPPLDRSPLCPCIPPVSSFNWRFNYNRG